MDLGLDRFARGPHRRSIQLRDAEETHNNIVSEQGSVSLTPASGFIGNAHLSRNNGTFPGEVVHNDVDAPTEVLDIPVLVEGVNATRAQISLYEELEEKFGRIVDANSSKWRLSGDVGVSLLKQLLDIVMKIQRLHLAEHTVLLDSWEFQLAIIEMAGIEVGWLRSYFDRVRTYGPGIPELERDVVDAREELKYAGGMLLLAKQKLEQAEALCKLY